MHSDDTDRVETARYVDVFASGAGGHLSTRLPAVLGGIRPAGPAADLGAGTGLGTVAVADCLPDARVYAVERSPGVRAVLLSRIAARADLRTRVSVVAGDLVHHRLATRGTALYTVAHDPNYGLPSGTLARLEPLLGSRPFVGALTWGTLAVESAVALGVLGTPKVRRYVLLFGILLHGGTILAMGLFSFGLGMIGVLLVACLSDRRLPEPRTSSTRRPMSDPEYSRSSRPA